MRRRGRELAPVGQHHVDQPAARRIQAASGFDDHRIHGVAVARDRPHVHPHPDAGDGEVTRGSRDEGGSREADRAGAQLGALVNVVHATEHVDVTDHVVAQRLRRRRTRIHVEGVDAALPVQPDRIEVQPLPVHRDNLIGRQRTGEKVKAPQDRLVRGQVGDDPQVILVRTESRVRHAPAGADKGRADLVDDAELEIGLGPRDKRQSWNHIERGPYREHRHQDPEGTAGLPAAQPSHETYKSEGGGRALHPPHLSCGYCLAKNTSGSCRPDGHRKLVTMSRLSPHAMYWCDPSLTLAM